MAKREHHILASYDVSDPRRLIKVGKIMKDYGERVLKSVFECHLSESRFADMKERIEETIDPMEDSVRYYFVCDKCVGKVDVSGLGRGFVEDPEVLIS
ncbi:CRISPR-associated endonuclease Cas2 [Desulfoferrobacter suflitae]|uniref:CRISPR-associated endonuclease Cas2 n=1 Tax=Desulfoferrobacter suflitae TaxID=2865782 RepID=UPI0021645937|nr:CRISPR-associated endonuclease Cas2 [Desulfoferrobacter suflitae]MCK8603013.1 CRISPR-associated endonuclease Cas2 [Desulfoferrobacter suflitae]